MLSTLIFFACWLAAIGLLCGITFVLVAEAEFKACMSARKERS